MPRRMYVDLPDAAARESILSCLLKVPQLLKTKMPPWPSQAHPQPPNLAAIRASTQITASVRGNISVSAFVSQKLKTTMGQQQPLPWPSWLVSLPTAQRMLPHNDCIAQLDLGALLRVASDDRIGPLHRIINSIGPLHRTVASDY